MGKKKAATKKQQSVSNGTAGAANSPDFSTLSSKDGESGVEAKFNHFLELWGNLLKTTVSRLV